MVPLRTTLSLVLASAITASTAQSTLSQIQNVVVLVQENR